MKKLSLFLILTVIIVGCGPKNPDTIASIDGVDYFRKDISSVYALGYFDALDKKTQLEKLQTWAESLIAYEEIQSFNKQEKVNYLSSVSNWNDNYLLNKLFETAIIEKVAGLPFLKNLHKNSALDKKVKHILINSNNPKKEQTLKLLSQNLSIANFNEMALKYSDDKGSGVKGGDLGFIKSGQMVLPFESAMYNTPLNTLSKPVQTTYGTHYLVVTEEKNVDTLTFEKAKPELIQLASNIYKNEIRTYASFYLDSLVNNNTLHVYDKNCQLLSDTLQSFRKNLTKAPGNIDIIKFLNTLEKPLPMALLNDSLTFYQDWLSYYLQFYTKQTPPFKSSHQINKFITDNFKNYLLKKEAEKRGFEKEAAFQKEKRRVAYNSAHSAYIEYIKDKTIATKKEKQSWYKKNRDKLYANKEKVQVQEILVTDSLFAESLLDKINKGESFDSLATLYTERKYSKNKKGILPFFEKGRYGDMGKNAFKFKLGEIGGPFNISKNWSVIKLIDKKEKNYKSFESVEKKVEVSVIKNKQKNNIEKSFKALSKKYNVKVYEENL